MVTTAKLTYWPFSSRTTYWRFPNFLGRRDATRQNVESLPEWAPNYLRERLGRTSCSFMPISSSRTSLHILQADDLRPEAGAANGRCSQGSPVGDGIQPAAVRTHIAFAAYIFTGVRHERTYTQSCQNTFFIDARFCIRVGLSDSLSMCNVCMNNPVNTSTNTYNIYTHIYVHILSIYLFIHIFIHIYLYTCRYRYTCTYAYASISVQPRPGSSSRLSEEIGAAPAEFLSGPQATT